MSRPRLQESIQERRLWSLDMTEYDRSPLLTDFEQEGLKRLLAQWADKPLSSVRKDLGLRLVRLLQPLYDILDALGVQRRSCLATIAAVCQEVHQHKTAYWVWSEQQWAALLTDAILRSPRGNANANANRQPCYQLLTLAYFIGPQTDFWLPFLKEVSPLAFARLLFGEDELETALTRVTSVLLTWGYRAETTGARTLLRTTLAEVFLSCRSASLEQVTYTRLEALREKLEPPSKRAVLERISKALAQLGIIDIPLLPAQEMRKLLPEHRNTDGVDPEWVDWCLQWYHFSDLTPKVKWRYVGKLFQTGRWLKQEHPEVNSPHQWTARLAAEYVAAVDQMKVGDFGIPE